MATLTVRGHGVADVEPGRVEIGLTVTARAATAEEAYADATARAVALVEVFDELGIPAASRVTEGLALNEEPAYPDAPIPRAANYTAWSRTRVRLADVGALRLLIGKAVDRAGAGIEGVQWYVDADHPARLDACRQAAEAARKRAQAYAEALGLPLGSVVAAVEAGAAVPARHRGM